MIKSDLSTILREKYTSKLIKQAQELYPNLSKTYEVTSDTFSVSLNVSDIGAKQDKGVSKGTWIGLEKTKTWLASKGLDSSDFNANQLRRYWFFNGIDTNKNWISRVWSSLND